MARLRKRPGERRINLSASLSNERDQLLARFQQAYCWNEGHVPTTQEINEWHRQATEQAIRAYIEAAEADTKAKMM